MSHREHLIVEHVHGRSGCVGRLNPPPSQLSTHFLFVSLYLLSIIFDPHLIVRLLIQAQLAPLFSIKHIYICSE